MDNDLVLKKILLEILNGGETIRSNGKNVHVFDQENNIFLQLRVVLMLEILNRKELRQREM